MVDSLVIRANKTTDWNLDICPCTSVSQFCKSVGISYLPQAPSVGGLAKYVIVDSSACMVA